MNRNHPILLVEDDATLREALVSPKDDDDEDEIKQDTEGVDKDAAEAAAPELPESYFVTPQSRQVRRDLLKVQRRRTSTRGPTIGTSRSGAENRDTGQLRPIHRNSASL